ncbi:MAG: hypothetical protein ACREH6_15670, partial [Geminicoccaceae bacterium]
MEPPAAVHLKGSSCSILEWHGHLLIKNALWRAICSSRWRRRAPLRGPARTVRAVRKQLKPEIRAADIIAKPGPGYGAIPDAALRPEAARSAIEERPMDTRVSFEGRPDPMTGNSEAVRIRPARAAEAGAIE